MAAVPKAPVNAILLIVKSIVPVKYFPTVLSTNAFWMSSSFHKSISSRSIPPLSKTIFAIGLTLAKSDLVNAKIKLFIINNNIDLSGLSYQMEYIIIGCIYMIEYSSNQLGLFPDDAVELSNINISFYNKYINEIKKLDNC